MLHVSGEPTAFPASHHVLCPDCLDLIAPGAHKTDEHRARADYDLQRKYDLDITEWENRFIRQHGCCAICGRAESRTRGASPITLAVDHNHATGAVRDLLCGACNTAIGLLGEDPDRLFAAIKYLHLHNGVGRGDEKDSAPDA